MINDKKSDVIAISCSMPFNICKVQDLIGTDAYSGDFESAYLISEKLSSTQFTDEQSD